MAIEKVRCINSKTNRVMFHPPHLAFDKSWQKRTGFFPEPIMEDAPKAATDAGLKAEKKEDAKENALNQQTKVEPVTIEFTEPNLLTEDLDDLLDGSEIGSEIGSETVLNGKVSEKPSGKKAGKLKSSHI